MAKKTSIYVMGQTLGEKERWADRWPQFGTERVSYEHMISPESYEIEREAVFRQSWLHVGRESTVARAGDYFTKEVEVLKTSVIVVRGKDQKIRAFHNTCPHRGNRLVWRDNPRGEVAGHCARFVCKYHGLGFGLDGKIDLLVEPELWFGEQGREIALHEVPVELWNGFIFVNFTPGGPKQSLREYIGESLWSRYDGYPLDKQTERTYLTGYCHSNWKALKDAFSEGWHGMTLHAQAFPMFNPQNMKYRSIHYDFLGEHSMWIAGRIPDGMYNYDIERLADANPLGGNKIGAINLRQLPSSLVPNPAWEWGVVTLTLFPNTMVQIYYPGWTMVYTYWPRAHDEMRFDIEMYHQVPRNFSELFSQKVGTEIVSDALLQDINTLEATQLGLGAEAFDSYPLIDEEVLVRHFHQCIGRRIADYRAGSGGKAKKNGRKAVGV